MLYFKSSFSFVLLLLMSVSYKSHAESTLQGESKGFVVQESAQSNRISLLVEIAKIRTRAEVYNSSFGYFDRRASEEEAAQWPTFLTSTINEETVADFIAIKDFFPKTKEEKKIDMLNMLHKLSDDAIAAASNNGFTANEIEHGQFSSAVRLEKDLEKITKLIFPTRKEYFYMASALLRIGGDYAAKGISKQGVILDLQSAHMATFSSSIVDDSRVHWISFCSQQSSLIKDFKKQVDALSDKTFAWKIGETVEATATDYYNLAQQALITAESLPNEDAAICTQ